MYKRNMHFVVFVLQLAEQLLVIQNLRRSLTMSISTTSDVPMEISTYEQTLLPDYLMLKIFQYFSQEELCQPISQVCKHWYVLSCSNEFWKKIYVEGTISFQMLFKNTDNPTDVQYIYGGYKQRLSNIFHYNPNNISFLLLRHCDLTDERFKFISNLKQLQELIIYVDPNTCENFTDESIIHIAEHLQGLKRLCIHDHFTLTDQSLFAISTLSNLRDLDISCLDITDNGLSYMSKNLVSLSSLTMDNDNSYLTRTEISSLHGFRNLTRVEFTLLEPSSERAFSELIKNNGNLRIVRLMDCELSGEFIYQPHRLRHLDMIFCQRLKRKFYKYFQKEIAKLDYFRVSINGECDYYITFPYVQELAVCIYPSSGDLDLSNTLAKYKFLKSPNLTKLDIWFGEDNIDQSCLEVVLANCRNLTYLSIGSVYFSDSEKLNLTVSPNIETFSAHSFGNVDILMFWKLGAALPNLIEAEFIEVRNVTPPMAEAFRSQCRYLLKLNFESYPLPPSKRRIMDRLNDSIL